MNDPLRVLFVVLKGVQNRLLNILVDELHPSAIKFAVVTLDDGGSLKRELRPADVPVFGLRTLSPKMLPMGVVRFRHLLKTFRPDIVHANLFLPSLIARLGLDLVTRPPPLIVTRHHNLMHHLLGKPVHTRLDAWTARRADRVIAVSEAVRKTLCMIERVPAARVSVIYNALDPSETRPSETSIQRWRVRFPERPLLVAAGRIDVQKDYQTLLRAFRLVLDRFPNAFLVVAGDGNEASRRSLEEFADSLRVSQRTALTGWVDDIYALMAASDVFVQSSIDEAFGLTILEAMTLRIPLATTTPGSVTEILEGFYPEIMPGDAEGLAQRIIEVITDPGASRQLAERAAAEVGQRFAHTDMAQAQLTVYRSVAR